MIVGLDARKLWDGGIGTYIRELLTQLAATPDGPELVGLIDPEDLGAVRWPGSVREIPVRASKYGLNEHWEVPRAAREAGVELLHEPHFTLPLGWSGRSVVTIHDLTHVRFAQFFRPGAALYARTMAGIAARRARVVMADSTYTKSEVIELLGIPEAKIRVVPLGVAASLSRPAPDAIASFVRSRGLPRDYLLYVGARKRHKNLELLLEALARIPAERRPPLVLSGGPLAPDSPLARLATQLGVGFSLTFAGDSRDDASLACLYAGAALYVHPALTEGFGLPPLEAMACGTPVLSSSGGSLPETVGEAAAVLPPSDPQRWAREIEGLLESESRRAELIRRGLARAREFTWARTASLTMGVYREAMAEKPSVKKVPRGTY
jgi:glycosyltransferase involved in cell wall biosynthesis